MTMSVFYAQSAIRVISGPDDDNVVSNWVFYAQSAIRVISGPDDDDVGVLRPVSH